jgi:hypothetical protein
MPSTLRTISIGSASSAAAATTRAGRKDARATTRRAVLRRRRRRRGRGAEDVMLMRVGDRSNVARSEEDEEGDCFPYDPVRVVHVVP